MEFADSDVRSLLELVYDRFHYDFRNYSMRSLKRRLGAALAALGCDSVPALSALLEREPQTFSRLLEYLTVQVSEMFRDPVFYGTMRARVVPELRTYPSLRMWIAGCSTGEEAYSFAILLREEGLLDRTTLYATDINPASLEKADAGIYPSSVSRSLRRTTSRAAESGRSRSTTRRPTERRASTGRSASASCSRTTVSRPIMSSPRCSSSRAGTSSSISIVPCRSARSGSSANPFACVAFSGSGAGRRRSSRVTRRGFASCAPTSGTAAADGPTAARAGNAPARAARGKTLKPS